METIYAQMAARTGGNIYIGVAGPVRTGKSTLIKRIMEQLVIPNIQDPYRQERARDELPQSGSGKTIMTSEPKFVPEEAVEITPDGSTTLRVRMIDSVGYMVEGAVGAEEDGSPRMVTTPWCDQEIPLTEAAELGTRKVMQDHSSIGLIVTTDGSITDIPRQDYVAAEKRAIADMAATGKPFLVLVNSKNPSSAAVQEICQQIQQEFGILPMAADCQNMSLETIQAVLQNLLYAFPMQKLCIRMPRWMDSLSHDHPAKASLYSALLAQAQEIACLGQAQEKLQVIRELDQVQDLTVQNMDLASGTVSCSIQFPEDLFYEILSSQSGVEIHDDYELMNTLEKLAAIKAQYDKVSEALESVQATGYGIVMPATEDMTLEKPEMVKKGGAYGVKLKAGASSIHMMRVDIDTEISPMVGGEQQSQELVSFLSGENPDALWESNIFGKSVHSLIQESLTTKLVRTPPEVREKFRNSLTKIVNDGASSLICIIL